MTYSSTFFKYLFEVLVETDPATYILVYCNASSMVFTTMQAASNSKKGIGFVNYLVSELR